ncbi:MAG: leucine--tRNA ligase [Microgenomates group bacterium]
MKPYHPSEIEPKWQKIWEEKKLFWEVEEKAPRDKKFYALVEFPYPSGSGLHIGHAFTMTIMDVLARQKRMEGKNVLYPMGWDAFGLPTENYAIKTGIHPTVATKQNTDRFRSQMKRLGFAYNWEREINTTDPNYYRWTQWIFIQFFKHGLAYKAQMPVGWCPRCKIILANEEIVAGKCERCGTDAERRMQSQWLLRITAYADRLIEDLKLVDYPDYVKESQINWIGRSEGIIIDYPVVDEKGNPHPEKLMVSCYTTRPDTNFGATFIVIAPEHPFLEKLITPENRSQIEEYIKISKKKSELERTALEKGKTGVFTGWYAINRLTGKKLPIWVADFVVLTAGTGMVVGVPAHDQRDFDFAKKYGLEIIPVIKPQKGEWDFSRGAFEEIDNGVVFNSDFLNGLPAREAIKKIIDYLEEKKWGRRAVNYHLRDWIFSRQHYWGEPIPMVYCEKCAQKGISWWDTPEGKKFKILNLKFKIENMAGWFPLPEDELPLELPPVEKYQPTETGESPLANIKNWVNTTCPHCGGPARRETDTMPNWAGSSWYYWRYCDPKNNQVPADFEKLKYWLPVDIYLGGGEHTTLHLLYSRFWHKFLYDIGVVPYPEPYQARRQHGVILGEDGEKMSKSRGNVVNPDEVVEKFGADTLRTYLCFMGPYDATMPWSYQGLEGVWRFLNRIWRIYQQTEKIADKTSEELVTPFHQTIKKVTEDINRLAHNTAISALMEFLNLWQKPKMVLSKKEAGEFLKLLSPFAPYLTEEIWVEILRNEFSIHQQPWPKYDPYLIVEKEVVVVIQVNGKVRGQIKIESEKAKIQSEVEKLAKNEPGVVKYFVGKEIRKVIFIPGKLINFVVS